jgi:hypothetical protein
MKNVTFINREKYSKQKGVSIDREFVSKIGNFLYSQKDIEAVGMKIAFKDGSILVFDKDEDEEDKHRKIIGREEDE